MYLQLVNLTIGECGVPIYVYKNGLPEVSMDITHQRLIFTYTKCCNQLTTPRLANQCLLLSQGATKPGTKHPW